MKFLIKPSTLKVLVIGMLSVSPAMAQLTAGVSQLQGIVTWMRVIAVLIATIAIMWSGFKVMFQGAKIHDVAPIVIGGILIGGATFFASYLLA